MCLCCGLKKKERKLNEKKLSSSLYWLNLFQKALNNMWHIWSYWKEKQQNNFRGSEFFWPAAFISLASFFLSETTLLSVSGLLIGRKTISNGLPRRHRGHDRHWQTLGDESAAARRRARENAPFIRRHWKTHKGKFSIWPAKPPWRHSKQRFSSCPWLITWLCNYEVLGLSDNFIMNSSRLASGCDSSAETSQ